MFVTTLVSALPFAFGLAATLFYWGRAFPGWLFMWLWVSYALLLLGQLRAWWIPYLLVAEPARAARYDAMFGNTLAFLPAHNGIRPNLLHILLHVATLATLIVLALIDR